MLGQGGLYENETLEHFNTDLKYNYQWHDLLIFEYLVSEVNQIWLVAREITISLITIFIGSKIMFCLASVFLSIDMLRNGIKPVIVLQHINAMGELGHFHHLKQHSNEPKLIRKKQRCDGNTNIVVIKAKKDKYVPDMTEMKIDSLDYFKCMTCRNSTNKNRRLLLLSTRVLRGQVDSQAPNISDCCSNLK